MEFEWKGPSPIYCLPNYPNECAAWPLSPCRAARPLSHWEPRELWLLLESQRDPAHLMLCWCSFKACLTVRVCAHSASPRQPHAWHKADRHCRTESLLQKQALFLKKKKKLEFFSNEGMGGGRKIPFKTHSKFPTSGAQAGNEGRREHGAKGGGESSSIQGCIFRLLLILFCHCATKARPVWINAALSFLIFAKSRLQS